MTRRPDGALETDVLRVLWASDEPLSPADVRERLDVELAYTSVATVLNRLCDKGVVTRRRAGRKYEYEAAATEGDLTAQRIQRLVDAAGDRRAVLAGFLGNLNAEDAAYLRRLLEEPGE